MTIDITFGVPEDRLPPGLIERRKRILDATSATEITPRYKHLSRREAFALGREYDHRKLDWFGFQADKTEVISTDAFGLAPNTGGMSANTAAPMYLKRPSAPLRLARQVVQKFTTLLFGEGRIPTLKVVGDDLSTDFVREAFKAGKHARSARMARQYGGGMGSVLFTTSLDKGRFVYQAHNPKTVEVIEWEGEPLVSPVAAALIQYVFEKMVPTRDPRTGAVKNEPKLYLYRRLIDSMHDVRFKEAEIKPGEDMPVLAVDSHVFHGLGYFPGCWIQNLPDEEHLDGFPDCEGGYQMMEAVDTHIAQIGRALVRNLDPTLVVGRDPKLDQLGLPLQVGGDNAINVGPGGQAQYLEYAGQVLSTATEYAKLLRGEALNIVQCGDPDPEKLSGAAQSAFAIKLLQEPQFQKAAELRDQYEPIFTVSAKITLDLARRALEPTMYPGRVDRVVFDLPPRMEKQLVEVPDPMASTDPLAPPAPPVQIEQEVEVPRVPGKGSAVELKWGPMVSESSADKQAKVATAVSAVAGEILDIETAVEKVTAEAFDVEDIEQLKARVLAMVKDKKAAEEVKNSMMGGMSLGMPPEPDAPAPPPSPPAQEPPEPPPPGAPV